MQYSLTTGYSTFIRRQMLEFRVYLYLSDVNGITLAREPGRARATLRGTGTDGLAQRLPISFSRNLRMIHNNQKSNISICRTS